MPPNHLILCPLLLLLTSNFPSLRFFFHWVSSSHHEVRVLEFLLQQQSFQRIFMTDFLYEGLVRFPCSPRDSQESSPPPQFKDISSLALSFLYSPILISIDDYWKNKMPWLDRTFFGKVMSLLINMLYRMVKTFHLRSKHLFTSWLQSPSAVILEPKKTKSGTVSIVS